MSLRLRLMISIGAALLVLWGATAAWMLRDIDQRMRDTLDQRLAMSARMVSSLMAQNPAALERGSAAMPPLSVPPVGRGIACQVTSLHGEVYARTPDAVPGAMSMAPEGLGNLDVGGEAWRTYTVVNERFRVTTADRIADRAQLLRGVTLATTVPFVVALVGSLLMLAFAVQRELRPLERLRQSLERRAPDSLEPVSEPRMPIELRPLVATLNALLERAAVAIGRERRFTSDAAHELRTPLTAITTHLQVARITHGTEAAQSIERALEGARRLQRTLAQLLMLSQVEGPFSWEEGAAANADEILRQAIAEAAAGGSQRINVAQWPPASRLAVPPALGVIALRNVLENALRYSPSPETVEVMVHGEPVAMTYTVLDRGPGMEPREIALATQRFWRKGVGEGSGLGLSIVAAIMERFGGRLSLAPREGGGLEVALRFPLSGE